MKAGKRNATYYMESEYWARLVPRHGFEACSSEWRLMDMDGGQLSMQMKLSSSLLQAKVSRQI